MKLTICVLIWFVVSAKTAQLLEVDLVRGLLLSFMSIGLALLLYIATRKEEPNDTLPSYKKDEADEHS